MAERIWVLTKTKTRIQWNFSACGSKGFSNFRGIPLRLSFTRILLTLFNRTVSLNSISSYYFYDSVHFSSFSGNRFLNNIINERIWCRFMHAWNFLLQKKQHSQVSLKFWLVCSQKYNFIILKLKKTWIIFTLRHNGSIWTWR